MSGQEQKSRRVKRKSTLTPVDAPDPSRAQELQKLYSMVRCNLQRLSVPDVLIPLVLECIGDDFSGITHRRYEESSGTRFETLPWIDSCRVGPVAIQCRRMGRGHFLYVELIGQGRRRVLEVDMLCGSGYSIAVSRDEMRLYFLTGSVVLVIDVAELVQIVSVPPELLRSQTVPFLGLKCRTVEGLSLKGFLLGQASALKEHHDPFALAASGRHVFVIYSYRDRIRVSGIDVYGQRSPHKLVSSQQLRQVEPLRPAIYALLNGILFMPLDCVHGSTVALGLSPWTGETVAVLVDNEKAAAVYKAVRPKIAIVMVLDKVLEGNEPYGTVLHAHGGELYVGNAYHPRVQVFR